MAAEGPVEHDVDDDEKSEAVAANANSIEFSNVKSIVDSITRCRRKKRRRGARGWRKGSVEGRPDPALVECSR